MTPLLTDGEERLRAASRAPVDVYAPGIEDERFAGTPTNGYWPYRWVSLADAEDDLRAVSRTVDRCESLRIDMGPGDPIAGLPDLCAAAESTGADGVVPRPLTTGLRQIEEAADDYARYDFRTNPQLVLPVGMPHAEIADAVADELTRAAERARSPVNIGLLGTAHLSADEIAALARDLRETVPGDTGLHLLDAQPSIELAAAIRWEPGLFDSVALHEDAGETTDESCVPGLSTAGRRDLSDGVDPVVALAADFSLLCSPYVDEDDFYAAANDSALATVHA